MQIQNLSGMTQLRKFLINREDYGMTEVFTADSIYYDLIDVLNEIKLTQGPLGVTGTLSKHPNLRNFLLNHQKLKIKILENAYDECYTKISENKSFKKAI